MAEKLPKQTVNIDPERERIREEGIYRAIGALTGFALVLTATQSETFNRYALSAADVLVGVTANQPVDADLFEEMTIIRVDNPDDDYEAGPFASEETAEQFINGVAELSKASGGRLVNLESPTVIEIELAPDAEALREDEKGEDVPYACYSDKALKEAKKAAFAEHDIARNSLTAISLESDGGVVCDMAHAGAYVTLGSYAEAGIYHYNSLRRDVAGYVVSEGVSPRPHIIPHELGHTAKIDHSSIVQYDYEAHGMEDTDSIEMAIDKGLHLAVKRDEDYGIITDADGQTEVAEYENENSVMGSLDFWSAEGVGYNFVEQNKLNPEAAQIVEIDGTEERTVPISIEGSVRGVVLDLPVDHPLQSIERGARLDKVYVGIEYWAGDNAIEVRTYLEEANRGATYMLFHEGYSPGYQHDAGDTTDRQLYYDETLGVTITVDSEPGDYKNATLHVKPIEK